MRSASRWAGFGLAIFLLGAQLVPVDRANPVASGPLAGLPGPLEQTLRHACYDCHSRETVWPWYSRLAPVSWLVAHDVVEGREHLDFSIWTTLRPARQTKLLAKIVEEVREGEMPPHLYALMHPQARLDDGARAALVDWAGRAKALATPGEPAAR
jgi:hypothetical protein